MKTSFWTIAAAALLLAGCSKEQISENVSDTGSLLATPTNGSARLGRPGNQPTVKFKNDRIIIRLNDTKTEDEIALDEYLADGGGSVVLTDNETTPPTIIELPLTNNNGNENQRYRTPQFELSSELEFDLFNIEIKGVDGAYLWGASIFIREDGTAVENNPVLAKVRRRGPALQQGEGANGKTLVVVVGDDPTEEISQVRFEPAPMLEDPTDPNSTVIAEFESSELEKTHVNQNIGRSRWIGRQLLRETARQRGIVTFLGSGSYGVDFLDEKFNSRVIDRYNVEEDEEGTFTSTLSDEPEILGARVASTTFGETWKMEIAVADLGDWVETAFFVLEEVDGSPAEGVEFPLEFVREDGNLRLLSYSGVISNLNPDGGNIVGTVYMNTLQGIEGSKERLVVKALLDDKLGN